MMKKALAVFLGLSVCGIASAATTTGLGLECQLGHSCQFQGKYFHKIWYKVTPKQGREYICTVQSADADGKIRYFIAGGADFVVTDGGGYHVAEPVKRLIITGVFKHPDDQDFGMLSVKKFSGAGSVTCQAR